MKRMSKLLVGILAALAMAVLAGCSGGDETVPPVDPSAMVGGWTKTHRVVDGSREYPIVATATYDLRANGTYSGTGVGTYTESGTWKISGPSLVIKMATNNAGRPASFFSAEIELADPKHFNLRYTITRDKVPVLVLEQFTRDA